MKYLMILMAVCGVCLAQEHVAEFVMMTPEGLSPSGAVATVSDLSAAAVEAVAAAAAADAAQQAAAEVQALVDGVADVINSLEGVGYVKGYMLDFGVDGTEANTNVTATIVKFVPNVSNDVNFAYCDLYTYFSEEPGDWPVARGSISPRSDATWEELTSVSVVETNVTVGATTYDCYRNTVAVPVAQTNAFFRIYAEAAQQSVGAFLPVRNGISVGGQAPLSGSWTVGEETYLFVGGVRCVPND